MKTLNEVIAQSMEALPPCEEYAKEEITIITMIVDTTTKASVERLTFLVKFGRVDNEGVPAWEVKDVETQTAKVSGNK